MDVKLQKLIKNYKETRNMNNMLEARWLSMFFKLAEFKTKHGHANVPARYKPLESLGYWIRRQRLLNTTNTLDPKRVELLRVLGFNFRLLSAHDWNRMFEDLAKFKDEFGHTHLTESYEDRQLHNWLLYQRKLYWIGFWEDNAMLLKRRIKMSD